MRVIEQDTPHRPAPAQAAFGAIKGRQREEAILVQKLTQHKFIANKVSYTISFYDSSNACYCCKHDSVQGYKDEASSDLGRNAIEQIVLNNILLSVGLLRASRSCPPRQELPPGTVMLLTCSTTPIIRLYRSTMMLLKVLLAYLTLEALLMAS